MSCFPEKNLYFCLTPSTSTSVWHSVWYHSESKTSWMMPGSLT
jgi:hypothetical protein